MQRVKDATSKKMQRVKNATSKKMQRVKNATSKNYNVLFTDSDTIMKLPKIYRHALPLLSIY